MSACLGKAKPSEPANGDFLRGSANLRQTYGPYRRKITTTRAKCSHTLLSMWGCRVVEACNGLEAVEAASRERPALILMDCRLPFLDGLGATRRIRENGPAGSSEDSALNGWAVQISRCGFGRWV